MPKERTSKPSWKRRWAIEDQSGIDLSPAFKKKWRKCDLFRRLATRSAFQRDMDRDLENFMTTEGDPAAAGESAGLVSRRR